MEIKHLTFDALWQTLTGRGSQIILRNLGMPLGNDGRYERPSKSWTSTFKNHYYPNFARQLDAEMADAILKTRGKEAIFTCDSTPLEASRYSEWADFNPHYNIHKFPKLLYYRWMIWLLQIRMTGLYHSIFTI